MDEPAYRQRYRERQAWRRSGTAAGLSWWEALRERSRERATKRIAMLERMNEAAARRAEQIGTELKCDRCHLPLAAPPCSKFHTFRYLRALYETRRRTTKCPPNPSSTSTPTP